LKTETRTPSANHSYEIDDENLRCGHSACDQLNCSVTSVLQSVVHSFPSHFILKAEPVFFADETLICNSGWFKFSEVSNLLSHPKSGWNKVIWSNRHSKLLLL